MQIEARKHVRYKVKDGTLAALSLPGKLRLTIGRVLDISENGVAFLHTDEIASAADKAELALLGYGLSQTPDLKFPARFIYRRKLDNGYRSGFEFTDLSKDQVSRLISFIQSNASILSNMELAQPT